MSIEKPSYGLDKSNLLSEEEKKLEITRTLEFSKEKQHLLERIEKDKKLAYLKSLIERGLLRPSTIEHIVTGAELNNDEVREIFEKIDEIELTPNIDDILPKNLRISKENYLLALDDEAMRQEVLVTLDEALSCLHIQFQGNARGAASLFTNIFGLLTQKKKMIMKIQGNVIDIKRSVVNKK